MYEGNWLIYFLCLGHEKLLGCGSVPLVSRIMVVGSYLQLCFLKFPVVDNILKTLNGKF